MITLEKIDLSKSSVCGSQKKSVISYKLRKKQELETLGIIELINLTVNSSVSISEAEGPTCLFSTWFAQKG